MVVDERRRLAMLERLVEVLGDEVADTLLAHLPPQGERIATATQVDALRADTAAQIDALRADTAAQIDALRADTAAQIDALRADMDAGFAAARIETNQLRADIDHKFELVVERMTSRWRRDLLLVAVPQFLVLLGVIVSLSF